MREVGAEGKDFSSVEGACALAGAAAADGGGAAAADDDDDVTHHDNDRAITRWRRAQFVPLRWKPPLRLLVSPSSSSSAAAAAAAARWLISCAPVSVYFTPQPGMRHRMLAFISSRFPAKCHASRFTQPSSLPHLTPIIRSQPSPALRSRDHHLRSHLLAWLNVTSCIRRCLRNKRSRLLKRW